MANHIRHPIGDCRVPTAGDVGSVLPEWLRSELRVLQRRMQAELYLAGGTVRDLVLGRHPHDVDLVVPEKSHDWARGLADAIGGAYVPLGDEDAARVVFQEQVIDFSSFREGAVTIEQDLRKRDLTINAMAVQITPFLQREAVADDTSLTLLDPCAGMNDLQTQTIRCAEQQILHSDPLRMLRAYRFSAVLGFDIDELTSRWIGEFCREITRSAPERIYYEFRMVLESSNSAAVIGRMADSGMLWRLFPELKKGVGMQQPASHHLDVFEHSLEALRCLEELLSDPCYGFSKSYIEVDNWLAEKNHRVLLKWAALFHDVGKPVTHAIDESRDGKITFYDHDQQGMRVFSEIAERLRMSTADRTHVKHLIGLHMRPFHLGNVAREKELTIRACTRLIRKAQGLLPGLFLLALADTTAGKGDKRPLTLEKELEAVLERILQVQRENVAPVLQAPPLVDGHDLIDVLKLQPGPVFKTILAAIQDAQIEGAIQTKEEALILASSLAQG
ncbi:HDIG domain-containing metalloprotein [Desulfogranum japonicum]|uniref:HDIG domain-containing metalloprotein n=1 Tax=Desulfogranum japonicum TaxID=231447 RepID=UPI0004131F38|nr:HDIG domain-containing metalloprotein [Desulfogranum japonicum]